MNNPVSEILLLQIAHRCGYTFPSMPEFRVYRGSGVGLVCKGTTLYGEPFDGDLAINVRTQRGRLVAMVNGQRHDMVVNLDGSFELFIAHSDGPE